MTKSPTAPGNWPSNVIYITSNIYSKSIPSAILTQLLPHSPALPNTICSLVRIKLITDKGHPACGQYGLFAARKLAPRSHVLDYMGYVHTETESDETSDYDICLDGALGVSIDAKRWGNEGRMVNDYRGIGQRPNVMFDDHIVRGERRMGIYVMPGKEIAKGEELLVSYGKGFWKARFDT